MADILKVGRKGEVVLPQRARAALGLREGDEVIVSVDDESIVLKRKARRFGEYLESLGRLTPGRDRA
ncbi:MAG TPA: AbrB/MazE/SpoVT family DNA-binding domain-containing protein [Candidatus Acidoferrales bacterium]|nr:AbrB/MazE/SpoVT family DNA-binding domain-containing protein [Candidatus Acidoferrales bacterium]